MEMHHTSEKELPAETLTTIIKELKPAAPVQAYRVVGNRVELFVQGGVVLESETLSLVVDLEELSLKELRALAKEEAISGYSKLSKKDLLLALREVS